MILFQAEAEGTGAPTKKKFDEFQVGQEVEARVKNKNRFGTFCDIGAEKDVILNGKLAYLVRLNVSEVVKAEIGSINLDKRQMSISCPDLEALVEGRPRPPKKKQVATKKAPTKAATKEASPKASGLKVNEGKDKVTLSGLDISSVDVDYAKGVVDIILKPSSKPPAETAQKKTLPAKKEKVVDPEVVKALEGMKVGQEVSGKVKNKLAFMKYSKPTLVTRVFVDIEGFPISAKLSGDLEVVDKLKWGEELPKLTITEIDTAKGQLSVELPDAETFVAGREGRSPLSTLQEGSVHVGRVGIKRRSGVFIDFGYDTYGTLKVKDPSQYEVGQEVKVKVLGIDVEKTQIPLEITD